jgi:MFS family permease
MKINSKYKWVVLIIFFAFMLLHQTDKLLIKPLAPQIYKEWKLTDTPWGAISTAPLIVGAVFYPVWGYLYDRFARSKLLALAPSSGGNHLDQRRCAILWAFSGFPRFNRR